MSENGDSLKSIHFREIAPAIEFVCWAFASLAVLLRVVNGPAVTTDQFVIHIGLLLAASIGGIGLRIYRSLSR